MSARDRRLPAGLALAATLLLGALVLGAGAEALLAAPAIALRSALAEGSYRVSWRALFQDGHRKTSTWSFRVR